MIPEGETVDIANLMPLPEGETVVDAELKEFGRGPIDLSLLPLYPDHTARHI